MCSVQCALFGVRVLPRISEVAETSTTLPSGSREGQTRHYEKRAGSDEDLELHGPRARKETSSEETKTTENNSSTSPTQIEADPEGHLAISLSFGFVQSETQGVQGA